MVVPRVGRTYNYRLDTAAVNHVAIFWALQYHTGAVFRDAADYDFCPLAQGAARFCCCRWPACVHVLLPVD